MEELDSQNKLAPTGSMDTYHERCIRHASLGELIDGIGVKTGRSDPAESLL
jgi:hypothetical protein